jgi:hypothetical protein
MKKELLSVVILFIFTSFIFRIGPSKRIFNRLYALQGKWESSTRKRQLIVEEWNIVNENLLEGKRFLVEKGDTTTQRLRFQRNKREIVFIFNFEEHDSLIYIYKNRNENEILFENHDAEYGRTLSYTLVNPQSLRVDRRFDGGKGETLFYIKVK